VNDAMLDEEHVKTGKEERGMEIYSSAPLPRFRIDDVLSMGKNNQKCNNSYV
jgi:hypothetical protein